MTELINLWSSSMNTFTTLTKKSRV